MSLTVGAVIAACSLSLAAIAYAVKISMFAGRLETRVIHLESAAKANSEVRDLVIKMGAQMDHMSDEIKKLSDSLVWLTKSAPMYHDPAPIPTPPRQRARKQP